MTDEQRRKARAASWLLRSALKDFETDLHTMSEEVVEIQWEQVQADMVDLIAKMIDAGVH
jgi:hypothetical protein